MRTDGIDDSLLVRYLLGRLTEEEQAEVEDRAFADSDYLAALDAAEADLIDAYVRDELLRADRREFEHRFLVSPQRLRKVEFAQALARVTAETAPLAPPVQQTRTSWLEFFNPIRPWNPALRFAGALGAVFCVAGGTWLIVENASVRTRLAETEEARRDLEASAQSLRQELSQAQIRAAAPKPAATPSTPLIASLFLMAGPTRAESRIEQIALSRGVQIAHIEIQLDARDDYPRFRAQLQTRSGREILSFAALERKGTGDAQTVSLDVPAGLLANGDYEIALTGIRNGEAIQDIGFYYFRVRRQ
jgi:hypothetical protein